MANYVWNDRGEVVVAIGAPGSDKRIECEHPAKLAWLEQVAASNPAATKHTTFWSGFLDQVVDKPDIPNLLRLAGFGISDQEADN